MITFTLNGKISHFEAENNEKLLSLLRRNGHMSAKCGCMKGKCGYCTVLLDDEPVPSCIIPVGILKSSKVETLKYFSETNEIYRAIMSGFDLYEAKMCGYCNSARIFSVYNLIKKSTFPTDDEIDELASEFFCTCIDRDTFRKAIKSAAENYSEG
ncbi:MAG: 2Fe-2S iron-sulfur cluster binding domain-containing protein [Treponema sp.]|nr:2Fe-2S iron-sulfur cluster binding domain-containing protein [Treponema sp.]